MSHLRSVDFDVNEAVTDFITADDQLTTSEAITDDIIPNTVKHPGTDHSVSVESDDEDDNPPAKPSSHAEAVDFCKQRLGIISLYMNAIQNVVGQQQFNSKNQCLVTDFSFEIIKENVEIKDKMNCWFSSPNQRLGTHLLRVLLKLDYFHQLSLVG